MKELILKDRIVSTDKAAFVMGIINATSDSFFSESRVSSASMGIERALQMIEDGADILDLGAESSRPGAEYVSADYEIEKLLPLIEGIRKYNREIPISIDTRKKSVIEKCVECGADILNDISALEDDPDIADYVAKSGIACILMHKRGSASDMQKNTFYDDVVKEVTDYLISRAEYALSKGIEKSKIIFDVGIGFGKDLKSNLQLVRNCAKICSSFGDGKNLCLMALSRKRMISELTGRKTEDALYGTLAANAYSVMVGSDIIRVHDVKASVDMINVLTGLMNE
ncbi:MAG: dihydropteroate synthase [Treponemataceae bacterium]|nr:dihydropteroate synthase [Treponemataceae bacterium]